MAAEEVWLSVGGVLVSDGSTVFVFVMGSFDGPLESCDPSFASTFPLDFWLSLVISRSRSPFRLNPST